ncbi:MAG: bifunctional DNA primase/polymerase, partial [Eggerthellaceae bacterium]|nr:bifunctional DNA primase/polymerase [Eggerthellaceae bacterium]
MDVVRLIGAPVFPCKAGGKQPATAHGCKDATDDPGRIGVWWPEGSDLNVAMATGGVVVIDFDDHGAEGGPCGFDALAEWE